MAAVHSAPAEPARPIFAQDELDLFGDLTPEEQAAKARILPPIHTQLCFSGLHLPKWRAAGPRLAGCEGQGRCRC